MFYEISAEVYKRILKTEDGEWLISYENPTSPFFVNNEQVYGYKRIQTPDEYIKVIQTEPQTDAEQKRIRMIQELIDDPIFIADKKKRKDKVKELASKNHTTERRIIRMFYRYLAKGVILMEHEKKTDIELSEQYKKFDWAIRTYYYSAKRMSLRATYDMLLLAKYMDSDGKLVDDIPSFHSFHYFYYSNNYHKKNKKLISREGLSEYQRNYRPLFGSAMNWRQNIGHYQMDATVADIFLVSRYDRKTVIGRPNIYMAVDTATKLIAGIYVGYEVGEHAVLLCLANSAMDKVEYCKQFGIAINHEDWPSAGLPGSIITDQGREFTKNASDMLCKTYGMEIETLPPFRPDDKSLVEKTFDIIQSQYRPLLRGKGVVEKDSGERWATDYKSQATLDLNDFTKIIIQIVLYLNRSKVISSYVVTKDMIDQQVNEIPSELWKWKEQQRASDLIPIDDFDIYRMSLKLKKGKINRKGIYHNGMYYKNPDIVNIMYRIKNSGTITIAYDPDEIKSIYMVENGEYVQFTMPHEYIEYVNLNETELQSIHNSNKNRRKELERQDTQGRIEMLHEIKKVIRESKEDELI